MTGGERTHNRGGCLRGSRNAHPTIGLLADHIEGYYQAAVWRGVLDLVQERDVNLICFTGSALKAPHVFEVQANVVYDLVSAESVDGLVVLLGAIGTYASLAEMADFCRRYHPLPMVGVSLEVEGVSSVLVDNYRGMYEIVSHLIEVHGFRRIVFVLTRAEHQESDIRYRAYTDALADHGISFDQDLVVSGDYSGRMVDIVHQLFDERNVVFDALVGVDDYTAVFLVEALQARGIRVPDDVAVVGFDDTEEARALVPPLTTVRQPIYEMGRRAVEMLLALLAGDEVPDRVILPTRMVVRRSCGCLRPTVTTAGETVTCPPADAADGKALQAALAACREAVVADMGHAMGTSSHGVVSEQAERLLDAFSAELAGQSPGAFLLALDEALRRADAVKAGVAAWQGMVSALRRGVLHCLGGDAASSRVNDLCEQAQVMIGQAAERMQAYQVLQAGYQAQTLREIDNALGTTFSIGELLDVLARELLRLYIPSFYLTLYEDPEAPIGWSRLMLAYGDDTEHSVGRVELEPGGRRFPSRQLVPEGMLPQGRRYAMVVKPLFFRENPLGLALFEVGPREGIVYQALRWEISSALQRALVLRARKEAEAALERAYGEVERQVEERTAELRQEIVERERAEAEILRLQHLLQNITNSMPSVLIALGPEGQVLAWNPAAEALTGRSVDQVQGRSLWQVCPELSRYRDLFEQVLCKRQVARRHRERLTTEGGRVYRDVDAFPLEANEVEGVVLRIDDVTRRVQLEEMMLQSAKMASVGGLAAGMAHEINNPLGAMMQSAQVLQMAFDVRRRSTREQLEARGVDPEGLDEYLRERGLGEYLEGIRETGARAAKIVSDLLSFSRRSSSGFAPRNLNNLVGRTLDLAVADYDLERKYDFRDIEIERELAPGLLEVVCDGQQIQQVVLNLVRNAAQAMAGGGGGGGGYRPRLVVRTMVCEGGVRLEVEDNGPGIPEAVRARLFEPFVTTKEVGEGTGLGLWLCWSIVVERHRGQIWLEPVAEGGSRFVVELPAERGEDAAD